MAFDPFFVVPDFNWTHNDFDGIQNRVDVLNTTVRIGAGARTREWTAAFYGGPMHQWSTKGLRFNIGGGDVPVDAEPKDAWSGVIGAFVGTWFTRYRPDEPGDHTQHLRRPTAMLTVEGGVGNRYGVLVSLRFEYDLFGPAPAEPRRLRS
jgi:hypothetical protein